MADIKLTLTPKLKQEQTLSTQMIQKMSLFTLPILELQQHIKQQIEENPALELPEADAFSVTAKPKEQTNTDGYGETNSDDYESSHYENFSYSDGEEATERKSAAIENSASKTQSLYSYLLDQLMASNVEEKLYEVTQIILSSLDDNGFFTEAPKDLIKDENQVLIEPALNLIQSFLPSGVGVPDFRESLLLQAKQKNAGPEELEVMRKMIFDYLPILRESKSKELSKKLGISEEDFIVYFNFIRTLTPYPGAEFSTNDSSYVVPELSITKNQEGNLELDMNKSNLPKIEISSSFLELQESNSKTIDKETEAYFTESINRAKLLIGQVNLRYTTLYNTGLALIQTQNDFFLKGKEYLKPLTLKEIAGIVGVHETTISRIAKSKWLETDWGIIPMKSLFTQGIAKGNTEVSRNVIKIRIEEIIKANEDKKALSDQKISELLADKGIKISRRTVNKYRKELNLDSSYLR